MFPDPLESRLGTSDWLAEIAGEIRRELARDEQTTSVCFETRRAVVALCHHCCFRRKPDSCGERWLCQASPAKLVLRQRLDAEITHRIGAGANAVISVRITCRGLFDELNRLSATKEMLSRVV